MGSSTPQAPAVAHFRRVWFQATETFLYRTVVGFRATRPVLIGYERANAAAFPVGCPVETLWPAGTWAGRWAGWRTRLFGEEAHPHFDTRRVDRILAEHGVGVLHAHFGPTGWRCLAAKRRSGLPLVTSFYGEDASRLAAEPRWRRRYAELFDAGERFLAEGPAMAQRLVDLGCPREKIAIQHVAVDPALFPYRERRPGDGSGPVRVLFCASFREKKGVLDAIEAFARARSATPQLVLALAGDGPLRARVDERIERLGIGDAVERLGFLSHDRWIGQLARCDLFLQPSRTAADGDTEGGAPTTLLEAQACGVPIVSTRHADIPYVVVQDESALLCDEGDVDALAANLAELAKQPERWAAMGRSGRLHVERFHDVAVEAPRLEELYFQLAGARAR